MEIENDSQVCQYDGRDLDALCSVEQLNVKPLTGALPSTDDPNFGAFEHALFIRNKF